MYAMTNTSSPVIELNNGVKMPVLGLGVYQVPPGPETRASVLHALRTGYRHIDTARFYRNEHDVGEAIRESGIPRAEIFVTTKLQNPDHGYDAALRALDQSLSEMRFEYVDLYLVHWPVERVRKDSWRAFEKMYADKKCRAIGVSNYTVRHLKEMSLYAKVPPAVNQVEMSPFLSQRDLVRFCAERKIQVECYSPLTQGRKLGDKTVTGIASKVKRTPAQVLLRWAIQHGFVVIPKSTRPSRIEENAQLFDFEIAEADMRLLDNVDEGFRTCWDPTHAP
jgi:diketogulonate reductase-like aldo/keto reductase